MKFVFALPENDKGKMHIKAQLVYRDAFKPLADMKGWKLQQRPMVDASEDVAL